MSFLNTGYPTPYGPEYGAGRPGYATGYGGWWWWWIVIIILFILFIPWWWGGFNGFGGGYGGPVGPAY